jgi:hypothetical protein
VSPDSPAPEAQGAAPKKTPLLFPSRIILFAILPFAIAALGFDYHQRSQRKAVFDSVARLVPTDTDATLPQRFQDSDIGVDNIHKVIGREPDRILVDNKSELQEVYAWRGVLYTYTVRVVYVKGVVQGTFPIVSGVYPEQQFGAL